MKDPALLWYFSDWNGGTMTLSRHLKGCYMDLLSAQFFNGPLSLEEIKTVLGSDFGSSWPALQKKFSKTSDGAFFNERLQAEKTKRANFAESRRKNRKGSKTSDLSSDKHMSTHMENENINENINEDENKGGAGGKQTIHIGEPNTHRVIIRSKYAGQGPTVIHDLRAYFEAQDQLPDILLAGWKDFDGFMKANPAAMFNDHDHLYHAFKNFSLKPANGSATKSKREILRTV